MCDQIWIQKSIKRLLRPSWDAYLKAGYYKLLSYLQDTYHIQIKTLCKKKKTGVIQMVLRYIIKDDNLEELKKIFNLELINKVDFSQNPTYYDIAFEVNSSKMLDYFANELSMICTKNVVKTFKKRRWGPKCKVNNKNAVEYLKSLELIGYPIDGEILQHLCERGIINGVKYICDKDMSAVIDSMLIKAFKNKHYNIVNYFIDKGYIYNKTQLLYKVLSQCYSQSKCYPYRRQGVTVSLAIIKNIINKYDAKPTKGCSNMCVKLGKLTCVKYLHKKYKLKPNKASVITYLMRHHTKSEVKNISTKLKYYIEELQIKVFEELKDKESENICRQLLSWNSLDLLKYYIKQTNAKFTEADLHKTIDHHKSLKYIQCIENTGIKITKYMYVTAVERYRKGFIVNYIEKKYGYTMTLKDVHVIINRNRGVTALKYVFDKYKIKVTPYTLGLAINADNRWYPHFTPHIIKRINKMTQAARDVANAGYVKLKEYVDNANPEIVEYEPNPDEVPNMDEYNAGIDIYYW